MVRWVFCDLNIEYIVAVFFPYSLYLIPHITILNFIQFPFNSTLGRQSLSTATGCQSYPTIMVYLHSLLLHNWWNLVSVNSKFIYAFIPFFDKWVAGFWRYSFARWLLGLIVSVLRKFLRWNFEFSRNFRNLNAQYKFVQCKFSNKLIS